MIESDKMKTMRQKVFFILFGLVFVFGVSVQEAFALNAPTSPSVIHVGEGSATVGWQWTPGDGTIIRFILSHKIAGAAEEWTKKYPSSDSLEYMITGLNENTTYAWTIMAEAEDSSDNSDETLGPSFTTLSGGGGGGESAVLCGNSSCEVGENPASCPEDCMADESGDGETPSTFTNPISAQNLTELFNIILNFLFGLAIFIVPVIIIYAAFLMLMGGGDPVKLAKGRMILFWTAIAFILILLSKGLPVVFKNLL